MSNLVCSFCPVCILSNWSFTRVQVISLREIITQRHSMTSLFAQQTMSRLQILESSQIPVEKFTNYRDSSVRRQDIKIVFFSFVYCLVLNKSERKSTHCVVLAVHSVTLNSNSLCVSLLTVNRLSRVLSIKIQRVSSCSLELERKTKSCRSNTCTYTLHCCRNVSILFCSQHIDILMRSATCGQYQRYRCFIACYRIKAGGSWDYKLPPSHAWESFASHAVSKCIHSWHLLRVRFFAIYRVKRFCKKKKNLTSVRGCYAWLYLHRFIWMCVCAAFGNDAFRMYYLRAVCGEWGEIKIAVRRSDQVILLLHSLRCF